ncbi:MAG: CDP-2,3-bis-(O-geranylgeranyl)-sn-glycerol synthase [archaeon]|nr:CDP-2,3-bis-(O-geranylgeranyl)-sn-glycerol synthase [Candidatus Micrarchaeota archaeon]
MIEFIARIALMLVPMYLANSGAMLLGGKTPLDLNKKFIDGREFLGKGKTWKGSFFGVILGLIGAGIIAFIFTDFTVLLTENYLLYGLLLSVGAILGDIAGSFLKRRLAIPPGKEAFPLDQLDFVLGGILLGGILHIPLIEEAVVIIIFTVIAHKFTNFIAFKIKLKKVPW